MIKLINSEYDKESGISYVTIQTELGNFSETALLHPEDADFSSSFLGCEIAEYRATINYFKKLLYRLNIEIKTLENLRIDFIRTYKEEYHECMLLEKRLKQKNKLKQEIKENIKSLKELIDNKINNRLIIAKRMQEKKEEKSE